MDKWLFFKTAADDSVCLPVRRLIEMEMDGNGTDLDVRFKAPAGGDDGVGEYELVLTIADNTGKTVMNTVASEIRSGKSPFVVVVDDVASEFLDTNIASCGTIAAIS